MGPVGPLGQHEEAANPSAVDEVPPLALRIPPCAWGICSSSCQQHPPPQHQASPQLELGLGLSRLLGDSAPGSGGTFPCCSLQSLLAKPLLPK